MGICCMMEDLKKLLVFVEEGIAAKDPTVIGILVAVFVVLLTIVLLACGRGSNKRRAVLLTGLCDAGKTLLFTRLVHGEYRQTHTSIKENEGLYQLTGKKTGTLRFVDLPGHERLRVQALETHKASARALVYVIDSLTLQKQIRDVAEYLYILLTDRVLSSNCPPVLILCNKQDATMAKGAKVIQAQLEKEINTLRLTKSAALEGTDNSGNNNTFLGKRNKDFSFADVKPFKVEFAEASCRGKQSEEETDLKAIEEWLVNIA